MAAEIVRRRRRSYRQNGRAKGVLRRLCCTLFEFIRCFCPLMVCILI